MSEIVEKYITDFKIFEQNLNGAKNGAFHQTRQDAIKTLAELGFPTMKNEAWKYTNLPKLIKQDFEPFILKEQVKSKEASFDAFEEIKANKLVFVDGFFSPENSTILDSGEGITLTNLANYLQENKEVDLASSVDYADNSLTALNTAFVQDGAYIKIGRNKVLEHPVILIFVSSGKSQKRIAQLRNIIHLEENSQAQIVESYQNGNAETFINVVTDIDIKQNAIIDFYKLQLNAGDSSHIGTTQVIQERDTTCNAFVANAGGQLVRNNINMVLNGEGCDANLYGIYILENADHVDNHIFMDHAKPNCTSNQYFKGLLNDKSSGVFNGKILVREDAQKTNAFQSNKNILLSDKATINSKPQLEIFADDVKCSHGATMGQMDKNALFYLRSRGLDKKQAAAILNKAFVDEIIEKVNNDQIKEYLLNWSAEKLGNQ